MSTKTSPHRIVVAYDFSDTGELALTEALRVAALHRPAELHVASVLEDGDANTPAGTTQVERADQLRERLLGALKARFATATEAETSIAGVRAFAHVRVGSPAAQVAGLAAEIRADLVVSGTHGRRGVQRLLLGSVAEKLVRLAPCPTLVVRPRDYSTMDDVPTMEPACPSCLAVRASSDGARWWCDEHDHELTHARGYAYSSMLDVHTPANHML